jgi:hypothetical protein
MQRITQYFRSGLSNLYEWHSRRFEPLQAEHCILHFGANLRDAMAGNYATQTITLSRLTNIA